MKKTIAFTVLAELLWGSSGVFAHYLYSYGLAFLGKTLDIPNVIGIVLLLLSVFGLSKTAGEGEPIHVKENDHEL